MVLSTILGDQLPGMFSKDDIGKSGATLPEQKEGICVKVGTIYGFTVMLPFKFVALQIPPFVVIV